ncbi:MAG: phosphomannomutase/phosphoglucomutase, partial [Proteobacteria bacterium]|nr:phosphomannomutase/phosphoglucomutase [Pseudomonadota bacterium]
MGFKVPENIFRQYDIRGVYEEDLTLEVAQALGRVFAAYLLKVQNLKSAKVSIGRDVRLSSTAIKDALIKGLTSSGIDCVDLGECPTPLQYFSIHHLNLDGGIMITGSHNPPEYNGFKLSAGKESIHGQEIQNLKTLMKNEHHHLLPTGPEVGKVEEFDIIEAYLDYQKSNYGVHPALDTPIKIVLDSGNGTAGPVAPPLMRALGSDIIELFSEKDGTFPNHHPDPTVEENLVALKESVKKEGADFGVAYDGDADRIGVVSDTGEVVWGDQLMIIFARDILERLPGATIVGEVKCSQVLYDEIEKAGGKAVMWKTGHSLIKSKMKELGAAMAGEMSGHIFFADKYFGFDDAVYATIRLAQIMTKERAKNPDFTFSMLLEDLPETYSTPEIRVECPDSEKFNVV